MEKEEAFGGRGDLESSWPLGVSACRPSVAGEGQKRMKQWNASQEEREMDWMVLYGVQYRNTCAVQDVRTSMRGGFARPERPTFSGRLALR